jgi:Tfp pilus assembly protein PilN
MRAVNLIPSEQRASSGSLTGRSGGAALVLVGIVFGVAVLALMYGLAHRQIAKESGEVATIQAQIAEVQARAGRLAPYTAFVSMAEQRTKTVAQLVQARFDWSHTMRELGRVLPSGSNLLTLNGAAGSAGPGSSSAASPASSSASRSGTPASSTPPGSTPTISLTGCSVSQSEVAQTLQRLKLMDGVSEVHLVSSVEAGNSSGGSSGASSSGGCPKSYYLYSVTVVFSALPATPIPNVAPTQPAAGAGGGARTVSASTQKGGAR